MNKILASCEVPEAKVAAILESLPDGRIIVRARDNKDAWTTTPFKDLDEVKGYIDQWFRGRDVPIDRRAEVLGRL